jgi:hypothetical protein
MLGDLWAVYPYSIPFHSTIFPLILHLIANQSLLGRKLHYEKLIVNKTAIIMQEKAL